MIRGPRERLDLVALNWSNLAALMRRPAWVFDARAVADPVAVKAAGLRLWRIGDGEG